MVALGCPKNIVDSEKMLASIGQAGVVITADMSDADVAVINTCGFIEPAVDEAMEAIRAALELKNSGQLKRVIVAGCLAERIGDELFSLEPQIDAIVGLAQRDKLHEIILKLANQKPTRKNQSEKNSYLSTQKNIIHDDRGRLRIGPVHWAYLRISEGCDRRCSFCTIPAIRGPFRSKPMDMVLDEANELVQTGAKELILIAQDTCNYGKDLNIQNGLAQLLSELEKIEPLQWIRVMYMYPTAITDTLIEQIANSQKILPYLDIPIQHVSESVLKNMQRPGNRQKTTELIEKLRSKIANLILRTTVIVGFPGEGQSQFDELMNFIKWAKFDALGAFTFYPEKSTKAAELDDQITLEMKQQRLEEVMLTQQEIVFQKNRELIDRELPVIIDSYLNDQELEGRYYGQAPEIDSYCIIRDCQSQPGQIINTKVIDVDGYDLIVKPC